MEFINQITYFAFALIFLGLSINSFHDLRTPFHLDSSQHYWAISAFLITISFFALSFYSIFGSIVLVLANWAQMSADISLGLLFRSLNTKIRKNLLWACLFIFFVLGAITFYLVSKELYVPRVVLICTVAVVLCLWQIYEQLIRYKEEKSIYIAFILLMTMAQIILWLYRIWGISQLDDDAGQYKNIFDEHSSEFIVRLLLVVSYTLVFIAISNYYYEKLWKFEKKLRRDREDHMFVALNSLALVRDNETGQHIIRTQRYVEILSKRLVLMGLYIDQLNPNKINALFKTAPLHDIGKVGIPDKILLKPDKLTADEWEIMKTHTSLGEAVLKAAKSSLSNDEELDCAIKIAGGHHERWDGTGYPRGLSGEAIPLEARIMALADMYDALVSQRVYKQKWSFGDAAQEIEAKKGTHFDPAVVEAFIAEKVAFEKIAKQYKD